MTCTVVTTLLICFSRFSLSSNITPRLLANSLDIGKEQQSSIFESEIILSSTVLLGKTFVILILLSFSFIKLQVMHW